MNKDTLFSPLSVGSLKLPSRIIMAPLTRGRAELDGTPNDLMTTYYTQRASAGLIISEATAISRQGYGWHHAPGIFEGSHEQGWKKITKSVHAAGGRIFLQLWHMGRVSHPDFQNGKIPVAPSPICAPGDARTPTGKKPYVVPRELSKADIQNTIQDYVSATNRAKSAGFDGVEIHAANGYLIDQFIRDSTNRRGDEYGGSVQNRIRFLQQVTEAVCHAWDTSRVGVRLSPSNPYNGMSDAAPSETFSEAAKALSDIGIGYLHILEAPKEHFLGSDIPPVAPSIRKVFSGILMVNGGYDAARAEEVLRSGLADLVAFGVPFIANPDLPKRIQIEAPLNPPDVATFYTQGEKGYTDYPSL